MSTPVILSTIMGNIFPKSGKAISEKLSTEEHNDFAADASEVNSRLESQAAANNLVVADLAAANATIGELTGTLTAAQAEVTTLSAQITSLNAQIASVSADRDLFKGYHEKAAAAGDKKPGEDENSRKVTGGTDYNQHAMAVWQKANA